MKRSASQCNTCTGWMSPPAPLFLRPERCCEPPLVHDVSYMKLRWETKPYLSINPPPCSGCKVTQTADGTTGYDSVLPQQRRSKWVKYSIFTFPIFIFFLFVQMHSLCLLKTKRKQSDLELVKTRRISLPWCRFWSNFTQATPYQQTVCAWLLSYGQRHSHNLHLFAWPIIASSAFFFLPQLTMTKYQGHVGSWHLRLFSRQIK